jgi:3-(3-hydroxy-phenyl)propionate hydroxylase
VKRGAREVGSQTHVDVLIVGAGPTGLTVANILGQAGLRTLVADRDESTVDEPRAVSIDDEALRVMQSVGLADAVMDTVLPNYGTRYRSPWGSEFAVVRPMTREYGFPRRSAFHQPVLESILLDGLSRFPSVEVKFGHECVALDEQIGRGPEVTFNTAGRPVTVSARFVIGADGASSTVRRLLGVDLRGSSFSQRWLVVDAASDHDDSFDTVAYCDHRRAAISLPGPRGTRRWEVLLNADETELVVTDPGWIGPVISRLGADPPEKIVRSAVYSFHARIAERWRNGSFFLAGDAAHLTPPYAGQGMNSGIRDASNLSWKLIATINGRMTAQALDSYETERKHHAESMIDLALAVGRVMTPKTAIRSYGNAMMFHAATMIPPVKKYLLEMRFKPRPAFESGLVLPDGVEGSLVGRMLPQPCVGRESGPSVLLDDVIGPGFALLRFAEPYPPESSAWLRELTPRILRVLPGDRRPLGAPAGWTDLRDDGSVSKVLAHYSDRVLLVRPDRYVAGSFTNMEAAVFSRRYLALMAGTSSDRPGDAA